MVVMVVGVFLEEVTEAGTDDVLVEDERCKCTTRISQYVKKFKTAIDGCHLASFHQQAKQN